MTVGIVILSLDHIWPMIPKHISFSLYKYFESINNLPQNGKNLSFFHLSSLKNGKLPPQLHSCQLSVQYYSLPHSDTFHQENSRHTIQASSANIYCQFWTPLLVSLYNISSLRTHLQLAGWHLKVPIDSIVYFHLIFISSLSTEPI